MKVGIVGMPNAGKTTLFNALSNCSAAAEPYPFCTIEPNVGVVAVPDVRLERLAEVVSPVKVTPTTIKFVDIAGLVKGASRGEGLGNQFLSHIREVDLIAHVVRCFADPNVPHPQSAPSPASDIDVVEIELALADLQSLEKRGEKLASRAKHDPSLKPALGVVEQAINFLERGKPLRLFMEEKEETVRVLGFDLLTLKPEILVANLSDADDESYRLRVVHEVERKAGEYGASWMAVYAKLECELREFSPEERAELLRTLGIEEAGLASFVRKCYELLGLITFFTIESRELRAWTVRAGTYAPQAAGEIHSDMERGFVKAEVVNWLDLVSCGSYAAARERGKVMIEGRNYVVKDGDVMTFRFVA